jgi:hypothetical protein
MTTLVLRSEAEMLTTANPLGAQPFLWDGLPTIRGKKRRSSAQIEQIRKDAHALLDPLANVGDRSEIEMYLRLTAPQFESLTKRLTTLMLEEGVDPATLGMGENTLAGRLRSAAEFVGDVLGGEWADAPSGVAASLDGLSAWAAKRLKRVLKGDVGALSEPPDLGVAAQTAVWRLWASATVIVRIAEKKVMTWNEDSLRVLVEAADEYMAQVEDEFWSAKSAARKKSEGSRAVANAPGI